MNEADRVAAQRHAAAARPADDMKRSLERDVRDASIRCQRQIPIFMQRMKAAGYPGIQQVSLGWVDGMFKKRLETKGGWLMADVGVQNFPHPVYLLSNKSITDAQQGKYLPLQMLSAKALEQKALKELKGTLMPTPPFECRAIIAVANRLDAVLADGGLAWD